MESELYNLMRENNHKVYIKTFNQYINSIELSRRHRRANEITETYKERLFQLLEASMNLIQERFNNKSDKEEA